MDRDTSHPLTPEEAKARLRAAAQQLSLTTWMSRHTWRALALALAGGFVVGRLRVPVITGTLLMQRIAPLLLTVLLRRRKETKNRHRP